MTEIQWTPYEACACVEGFGDQEYSEEECISAWQYIADTGMWRGLQGWYGRMVFNLIDQGIIQPPKELVN